MTTKRTSPEKRLKSLDALRGFDMFWIIGGGAFFLALRDATGWGWLDAMSTQLEHVPWDGFKAWDLIFPLFMFISGVAIPFAVIGKLKKGLPKSNLVKKVIKRGLVLILLGFVYNGIFKLKFGDPGFRFASVLGQIGLAYLIASLIFLHTRNFKFRLIWLFGILLVIAVLQLFVPVPGFGAGELTPEGCINAYIDQRFLPGRLHGGTFDPEGWLCAISAAGITLMGALAGEVLRNKKWTEYQKIGVLVIAGVSGIILAVILKNWYPIIKSAWTTTFNLLAGGISFLLLALFYMVVDVWKWRKWAFFFRIIGLNSITIYLGVRIIDFYHTSGFFFGGLARISGDWGHFFTMTGVLLFEWLFLYFLYKKKIFLRV
jgi:predicted acyltransferase